MARLETWDYQKPEVIMGVAVLVPAHRIMHASQGRAGYFPEQR